MTALARPSFRLLGVLLAVAWLSFAPTPLPDPKLARMLHPLDHVGLHALLGVICLLEWPAQRNRVIIGLIGAAVAFEVFQMAVPVRAFEWGDLIANLAGVGLGIVLYRMICVLKKRGA